MWNPPERTHEGGVPGGLRRPRKLDPRAWQLPRLKEPGRRSFQTAQIHGVSVQFRAWGFLQ